MELAAISNTSNYELQGTVDLTCLVKWEPRHSLTGLTMQSRFFVLGGRGGPDLYYHDVWYRDSSPPKSAFFPTAGSAFQDVQGGGKPLTESQDEYFFFDGSESGLRFQYHLWHVFGSLPDPDKTEMTDVQKGLAAAICGLDNKPDLDRQYGHAKLDICIRRRVQTCWIATGRHT